MSNPSVTRSNNSQHIPGTTKRKKCWHCKSEAVSRGLCLTCNQAAHRKVRSGEVTWDLLEKLGLCEVKPKIPFIAALEAALDASKGHTAAVKKSTKKPATHK